MPRLRGNAEGTMDQKCRAGVPAKFSAMFPEGEELVLWEPQGNNQPYLVLSQDRYFEETFDREYALADKAQRQNLLRDALGHIETVKLDAAGRFVIPERYHDKAGFDKGGKLFFLANQTYMEIWPLPVWRAWENARRQEVCRFDYTPDPAWAPAQEAAQHPEDAV